MRTGGIGGRVGLLALALTLLVVAPASATFHLIQVREVYPGSASSPAAEYVELQMHDSGQQFVSGHILRTFDANGSLVKANVIGSDVANGSNQRTVLFATPEAEAQFGLQVDATLAPSGQLDPAGGAVCWEALDCVSWGSFGASTTPASGPPADPFGIPEGMALRRSIAPGCPTLLEEADDSNSSATDFADAFPAPRPNAVPPDEHACPSQGAGGNAGPENGSAGSRRKPPQTRLRKPPGHRTRDRTPTFRFVSTTAGSIYLCKLDGDRFKPCHSPFTMRRLDPGGHVFKVKARAPGGPVDPSPAIYRLRVLSGP